MTAELDLRMLYTESVAAHYDRLVEWGVQDWVESPRTHMAEFVEKQWSAEPDRAGDVLELCCGTGLMLGQLAELGYAVTGLDRSRPMLERARQRLEPTVPLVNAELPEIPIDGPFDAVISAAAGLNYLTPAMLAKTLVAVAEVLRPGGTFVFDTLSRTMLQEHLPQQLGRMLRATNLGDAVFLWDFRKSDTGAYSDLNYIQFSREPGAPEEGPYVRTTELHRMHVHDRERVRSDAEAAGFDLVGVFDDYTATPVTDETLHDTWVLTLR